LAFILIYCNIMQNPEMSSVRVTMQKTDAF